MISQNAEINKTTVNGILSYKCSICKNDIKRNKTTKYQQSMEYFLINVGYHPLRVDCIINILKENQLFLQNIYVFQKRLNNTFSK